MLKGVFVHVRPGEVVTLIGGNGAGKSTILRTICGLLRAHKGSLEFAGQDLTLLTPEALWPWVWSWSPRGAGLPDPERHCQPGVGGLHAAGCIGVRRDLEELRQRLPMLKERAQQAAGTWSGGQQQILAMTGPSWPGHAS